MAVLAMGRWTTTSPEPAPEIYVRAKPEEGWSPPPGSVPPNRETPRIPLVEHRYRLVRTYRDTAHYEHLALTRT